MRPLYLKRASDQATSSAATESQARGIEVRSGQMGKGMVKREAFERGAHLRDFGDRSGVERRDTHAAARLAHREPLGLELPKGFTNGHVTRPEFFGEMVLHEAGTG